MNRIKEVLEEKGIKQTWLADVHLAGFAPAFPLSLWRQEIRPQAAQAHSLGRCTQAEKTTQ